MHVIADKKVFINYLEACHTRTRSADIANLKGAFENSGNTILLSKSMLERIESEIISNPELLYEFQAFIKEIADNQRLKSIASHGTSEEEDLIEVFTKERINNYVFVIVNRDNVAYKGILSNCCIWSEYSSPNKNWIILSLLANRTLTVRYLDFTNDREIKLFFENYFNLDNRTTEVVIIDSYCHLHKHTNFEVLKKGCLVRIYTSSYNKTSFDIKILKNNLKTYFGSTTSIKFSSNNAITHERTLARNNFILESNHDFAEIKRRNQNWKIDVTFDKNLKSAIDKKCSQYN